jgi:hypothetical protein
MIDYEKQRATVAVRRRKRKEILREVCRRTRDAGDNTQKRNTQIKNERRFIDSETNDGSFSYSTLLVAFDVFTRLIVISKVNVAQLSNIDSCL